MTTTLDKVLYTARTHTTGGRDGQARSDDGRLQVTLSSPGQGTGTNPEQMFAAGYSACFIGAIKVVAGEQKGTPPPPPAGGGGGGGRRHRSSVVRIAVRLTVSLPGMDRAAAQALVDGAHQVCPYSNATRGNIPVEIKLA